jgi:nucleoside-diphosphate-sugar epimerase
VAELPDPPDTVILVSSASVCGNVESLPPIPEAVPVRPVNDYGISKMAKEHVAAMFADRLPITIVHPFNHAGVDQSGSFLPPRIVDRVLRRCR